MRRRYAIFALAITGSIAAIAVAAGAAAPVTTTYHGTFSGEVTYTECSTPPTTVPTATGMWNVALHGGSNATATFNIFTNGKHHVSFSAAAKQDELEDDEVFAVLIDTGASTLPDDLRVSLTENGTLTYRIGQYDIFDVVCDSVTYHGERR